MNAKNPTMDSAGSRNACEQTNNQANKLANKTIMKINDQPKLLIHDVEVSVISDMGKNVD